MVMETVMETVMEMVMEMVMDGEMVLNMDMVMVMVMETVMDVLNLNNYHLNQNLHNLKKLSVYLVVKLKIKQIVKIITHIIILPQLYQLFVLHLTQKYTPKPSTRLTDPNFS